MLGSCLHTDGAQFVPKVAGSKWTMEVSAEGQTLRVSECPAGYALLRKQNNPQSDSCVLCPGSSENGYSLQPARWSGNESDTGLDFFCEPCPQPGTSVLCSAGTTVTSEEGWWLVQEEAEIQTRRDVPSTNAVFKTYKCDPGVCLRNNTCLAGRTGVTCGRCPDNHVLQVRNKLATRPEKISL